MNNWWKYLLTGLVTGGAGYLAGWLVTKKLERKKCDEEVQSVIEEFKGKYGPGVRSKKLPGTVVTKEYDRSNDMPLMSCENRDIFSAPKQEEMSAYHKIVRTYEKPEEKKEVDTVHKVIREDEIESIDHDVYYYWPNGTVMDYYNNIIPEQELADNVGDIYIEYFKTHPDEDSVCIRNTATNDEFEIIKETDMDLYPLDEDERE